MRTVKAVFYLPLRDNDGRDLTQEIEDTLAELFARFGGWTFQGYVQGAFRMADGSQALDVNGSYMVVLPDAEVSLLEQILRQFKARTLQEAIYLEVQRDVEVRLVR